MTELQQLKKKLLRGAVTDNVDLISARHPRLGSADVAALRRRRFVLYPLLALVAVAATPWLAAALLPEATREHARWIYALPGTGTAVAAEVADGPGPDAGAPATEAAATTGTADGGEAPSPGATITVSAADTLEDLNLRFEAPPPSVPRELFELPVRRIILDPGHGGDQLGTSAGDLAEKEITLDIALRLRDLLEERSYEVFLTREDDRTVEHDDRVAFANENDGDIFLSIHVNWFRDREIRGIETFHLGPTVDPELTKLIAAENRGSGYSLTDFRRLLDGIYVDIRREESRALARAVHGAVFSKLRSRTPGLRDRGVKQAPFVVLIGTEMPAILAEVSYLSNREEARLLRTDAYRDTIASALADGVDAYADSLRPEDLPPRTRPAVAGSSGGTAPEPTP